MSINLTKEIMSGNMFSVNEKVGERIGLSYKELNFYSNIMPNGIKLSKKIAKTIKNLEKICKNCKCTDADPDPEEYLFDYEINMCGNCVVLDMLKNTLHELETHKFSKKCTIYISDDIECLKEMSDNKGWDSCVRKEGGFRFSVANSIWRRDAVAYAVKEGRDSWSCRLLLRRNHVDNKFFTEPSVYGDKSIDEKAFEQEVVKMLKENNLLSRDRQLDKYFFGQSDSGLFNRYGYRVNGMLGDMNENNGEDYECINIPDLNEGIEKLNSKHVKFGLLPSQQIIDDKEIDDIDKVLKILNDKTSWRIVINKKDKDRVHRIFDIKEEGKLKNVNYYRTQITIIHYEIFNEYQKWCSLKNARRAISNEIYNRAGYRIKFEEVLSYSREGTCIELDVVIKTIMPVNELYHFLQMIPEVYRCNII